MDDTTDESFEALLSYLRDSRGFDFTGYKVKSVAGRYPLCETLRRQTKWP